MLSEHIEVKDSEIANKFAFSKSIIDSDLFKYSDVRELFDYISNNDAEMKEVKFLVRKANMKLRMHGKKLFIRKSLDKELDSRICLSKR